MPWAVVVGKRERKIALDHKLKNLILRNFITVLLGTKRIGRSLCYQFMHAQALMILDETKPHSV
jgi:hypothetical protein